MMSAYNFEEASLKILFETGMDKYGKPQVTTKTYRNVRNDIPADQIAVVAQVIASLSKYSLHEAKRSETEAIEF